MTHLIPETSQGHLSAAAVALYDYGVAINRHSYIFKPKLSMDGNMWCALFGDNLQDGVAGFGKSPELAYQDFDKNWIKQLNI